jgi:hypothetical protein
MHLPAELAEVIDDFGADEAGGSCDEEFHFFTKAVNSACPGPGR